MSKIGSFWCNVKFNGNERKIRVYVIKFMRSFNLKIEQVNNKVNNETLNKLLTKYNGIFKNDPGLFTFREVLLQLKPDAKPIYLKPIMEKELDQLEKQGIIAPVTNSEWGTPLVVIPKMMENSEFAEISRAL